MQLPQLKKKFLFHSLLFQVIQSFEWSRRCNSWILGAASPILPEPSWRFTDQTTHWMAVSHQLSSLRRRSFPSREARAQADGERTAAGCTRRSKTYLRNSRAWPRSPLQTTRLRPAQTKPSRSSGRGSKRVCRRRAPYSRETIYL